METEFMNLRDGCYLTYYDIFLPSASQVAGTRILFLKKPTVCHLPQIPYLQIFFADIQ